MSTANYPPPVNKFLTLGECKLSGGSWPDYLPHGFAPEYIPDLMSKTKAKARAKRTQQKQLRKKNRKR